MEVAHGEHGGGRSCQLAAAKNSKNQLLAAAPDGRHGRAYDDSSEAACASEQLGPREAARWGLGRGDLDLEAARRDGHIQSRFELGMATLSGGGSAVAAKLSARRAAGLPPLLYYTCNCTNDSTWWCLSLVGMAPSRCR